MKNVKTILDGLFYNNLDPNIRVQYRSQFQHSVNESYLPSQNNQDKLGELFGKNSLRFSESIGTHPDFTDLKSPDTRNQYIVSLFLDISGSTKLGLKFSLDQVLMFKKAILESAIEIFQTFDAHIHRLQGDAIFAFFGHKNMKKSDAIINALNAASIMQLYNQSTLTKFFEDNNLPPLKIRIGIDIGDDDQVLWSSFGIKNTCEITTTSIHTDLAAKLQSKAPLNSILIGENIYKFLDIPDHLLKVKEVTSSGIKKEVRYIIEDSALNKRYQMRIFNWEKYLDDIIFLPRILEHSYKYSAPIDFTVRCYYSLNDTSDKQEYFASSFSLNKNISIKFEFDNLKIYEPYNIKWFVKNFGEDAKSNNALEKFEMTDIEDQHICPQATAYNGYHFMICQITDMNGIIIGKEKFAIYVNDNSREMVNLFDPDYIAALK